MSSFEELQHLHIPLQDISSATNDFAIENYIGLGGFGKVYKGISEKHGIIAIKRLDRDRGEYSQGDQEFQTEIALLSIYKHDNIVCLQGFCDEDGEKILVYKYESNGSLDKHLESPYLTWTQRLHICLDAARGLKYLHDDVAPQHRILHRDVKSANILLDENWKAKISDFGLSKKGPANVQSSFVISNACGTLGYIDPEYFYTSHLTPKSDVFSFGVVLFEVLCGRPAFLKVDRQFFFVWVQKHYKRQTLDKIIYSDLHEQINTNSLRMFSKVAYQCLSNGEERPTMNEVVKQLQKALDYQLAPSGTWSDVYDDDDDFSPRHRKHTSEASANAASEALAMILRLQREKASVEMESEQYKRLAEEKMHYAEESMEIFEEIIHQKEMEIANLEYHVQAYSSRQPKRGTTSSSQSSPATSQSRKYDVYLSFRGEDTRMSFVDHLYSALAQQLVYKDELLPKGEHIGSSMFKAIKESKIAIVIFSENYANSRWCLDELAYIMKCRAEMGLTVIPVFYHVDPSEVRGQKGRYETAFSIHELENKENVGSWRKALEDAADISGFVVTRHEAKAIEEIVYAITHTYLSLMPSDEESVETSSHNDLIGIETRMQDLRSRLEIGPGGVRMIGICGIWGSGKSTLASSIYDEISHAFEGCSFIKNVRSESRMHGLKMLQEKILADVFKSKVTLRSIEEGISMMETRLCQSRVLIVLDDVDHMDHLKMLAGSPDWFGDGSRIIITTRNQDLVNAHNCVTHNVRMLEVIEAIELFSFHAFGESRPVEGYEELSRRIVSKFGGHPSVLTRLGFFLHDKDMTTWKSILARLEGIPVDEILEKFDTGNDGVSRNAFSWLAT